MAVFLSEIYGQIMKRDINVKEFLEQTLLCAVAIGVVFHLNSKISPKSQQDTKPQEHKVEHLDSAQVDSVRNIQKKWVLSENIKSR